MTALPARSLITSSSYSFHPSTDSSTSTSPIGEATRPAATAERSDAGSAATPGPPPPVGGGGDVERRLPAQGGQQGIGTLPLDHGGHHVGSDRLDVGGVGELGVGHDRRRVRVDEDHPVALFAQH